MNNVARLLILTVALPCGVGAQTSFKLGVSGGATIPLGVFSNLNKSGYNFGAHAIVTSPFFPQDFKLEVQHNRLKLKNSTANTMVTSATLNLEWSPGPARATIAPYISAGLGGYYVKTALRATPTTTQFDNVTKFGLNAGGGVRIAIAGFNTFLDARWHRIKSARFISSSIAYVPISFGVTF